MMYPPPPADAPIWHWSAAIREDIMSSSGLAESSAVRAASGRTSLFTWLMMHGVRYWPDVTLDLILDWAGEPIRDRHGDILRDRDPDEQRSQRWKAKHIIAAAIGMGAPVPLLDDDGAMRDFLHPPPKPVREPDDPADIADAVAVWWPQRWRHGSVRNLDKVLPDVRERVLAAEPANVHRARRDMAALSGFALWAVNDRHSDPVAMHTQNNVEVWVTRVNASEDDDWKNRARGALRRLGPVINPSAWPRPPQPIPRRGVVSPYDAKAEMQFRRAAMLPRRDRRARMWVYIAASGAGLDGTETAAAEFDDLIERPDGRWEIVVRGDRPRRVPIRRACLPLVEGLVAMEDRRRFVASDKISAASQVAQRIRVGNESLSLTKSRNTFLAAHLEAGTPPAALSVVAGGVAYGTLDRLLPYVAERLDIRDAVEQALGP